MPDRDTLLALAEQVAELRAERDDARRRCKEAEKKHDVLVRRFDENERTAHVATARFESLKSAIDGVGFAVTTRMVHGFEVLGINMSGEP